jgi:hypothetical protein
MVIAALLVIPLLVIEESSFGEPWDTVEVLLNWGTIIDFTKDLWASFATEGARGEVERVRTMGDCVVLGVHSQGRGKGSGVPVDVHWAITLTVSEGKIARADVRGDYAKALEAAGIEE